MTAGGCENDLKAYRWMFEWLKGLPVDVRMILRSNGGRLSVDV
ncbi:MAG: hypothetical protein ACXVNF_12585 [Neobacillus sp.]